MMVGAAFSMNFSMRAGPKGAAPPVTECRVERCCDLTAGFVDRKLTSGGTRFKKVGWSKSLMVQNLEISD